jgi:hypothetical protein
MHIDQPGDHDLSPCINNLPSPGLSFLPYSPWSHFNNRSLLDDDITLIIYSIGRINNSSIFYQYQCSSP